MRTDHHPDSRTARQPAGATRRALLVDVEPANAELIRLWLAAEPPLLIAEPGPPDEVALILVEMAFPRQEDRQRLGALSAIWPGVPVIVLSPTLLPGVSPRGEVARQLGVAAVLPTPLSRESLCAAVAHVLERAP